MTSRKRNLLIVLFIFTCITWGFILTHPLNADLLIYDGESSKTDADSKNGGQYYDGEVMELIH